MTNKTHHEVSWSVEPQAPGLFFNPGVSPMVMASFWGFTTGIRMMIEVSICIIALLPSELELEVGVWFNNLIRDVTRGHD